jgi:hypothetical protein
MSRRDGIPLDTALRNKKKVLLPFTTGRSDRSFWKIDCFL